MKDVRRRIEAALEIARRPTTLEGERAAALNRANAMIERHGLDPDDFDIPGRKRRRPLKVPPPSAFREELFSRPRSPFFRPNYGLSPEMVEELRADLAREIDLAMKRAAAQMNDPAYRKEVDDFLASYRAKGRK